MKKLLLMMAAGLFTASLSFGQACLTYVDGPWINFNQLGGAPCSESPPETVEITGFEVWGGEAYLMDGVKTGGQYTFSACNSAAGAGMGGQAWDLHFTVIAPSGAVDAFGLDGGSSCELTWTATETGEYTIVVSEDGNCGNTVYTDNGYPAITYLGGASCDPPITTCEAGVLNTSNTAASVCPGDSTVATVSGMIIPNSPTQGGAGVQFTPVDTNSAGGLGGVFVVSGYSIDDFSPYYVDNDIQGVLSFNGYPALSGEWELMPYVYGDQADVFAKCDSTASFIVNFLGSGAPGCAPFVCEAGDVSATDQAVCPTEDVMLSITGEELPIPGDIIWYFFDTVDVSGANDLAVNFGSDPSFYNFTGDLNDLLAFNGIDTLSPSTYFTFAGIAHADTICDLTDTGFYLTILDENDPQCGGEVPCELPYPTPTNPMATVVQSPDGVILSWDPINGSAGCQIKAGAVAGGPQATITVIEPNASEKFIPGGMMQVGTTYFFRVRCGCTRNKVGPFTAPVQWTYTNFLAEQGPQAQAATATRQSVESPTELRVNTPHILSTVNNSLTVLKNAEVSRASMDHLREIKTFSGDLPAKKVAVRHDLNVYPNPSTGMVNVRYEAATEGEVFVKIHDVVGKTVFARSIAVVSGANVINLDLESFDKGIYFVEIEEGRKMSASKMVLK